MKQMFYLMDMNYRKSAWLIYLEVVYCKNNLGGSLLNCTSAIAKTYFAAITVEFIENIL